MTLRLLDADGWPRCPARASFWQTIFADFDGVGFAFSHDGDDNWFTVVVGGVVVDPALPPLLPQRRERHRGHAARANHDVTYASPDTVLTGSVESASGRRRRTRP